MTELFLKWLLWVCRLTGLHPPLLGARWVSRNVEVRDVLKRDHSFGVPYSEKMTRVTDGGRFFLGLNGVQHQLDLEQTKTLFPPQDVSGVINHLVSSSAERMVDRLGARFDFVSELAQPVAVEFAEKYLGYQDRDGSLVKGTQYLFEYLFFPESQWSGDVETQALVYAEYFRAELDQQIQARKNQPYRDDVLGRAIQAQSSGALDWSDQQIRDNLMGLLIGCVPTLPKCAAEILDWLCSHSRQLSLAQELAQARDDHKLELLILEVLRFKPFNPGVFRVALRDTVIAEGARNERSIAKGESVFLSTWSAMWDSKAVDHPRQFKLDRPEHIYMPFGYGPHTCFGDRINRVVLLALLRPLLKKSELARAGTLKKRSKYPSSLIVCSR